MLGHNPFFHNTIRKYVVLMGSLFNDIFVVRETEAGVEKERQKVPILYGPKEKWLTSLRMDPTLTKTVMITLPRMSFELMSLNYDQTRKQESTIRHRVRNSANTQFPPTQYVGVPYNFDFSVSVYVRNITDGLQIVEQILPFFLPDYTVSAQVSQELDIVKDIPIILRSVTEKVDYEGAMPDGTRIVTWDLEFTLKGYIFGPIDNSAIIKGVSANVANANAAISGGVYINLYTDVNNRTLQKVVVTGGIINYLEQEAIREPDRGITGTVYSWNANSNTLILAGMTGVLGANDHLWGLVTGSHWTVQSIEVTNLKDAEIWITQNPISANADSDYGYTTVITEFPDTLD
jgi:hypothetical protein